MNALMKASTAIALCFALSLGLSPRSEAGPIMMATTILFDPDGGATGLSPVLLSTLNFNPGNLLAVGALPALNDFVSSNGVIKTPFDVIVQTSIDSTTGGNPFSLPVGAEITMVLRAQQQFVAFSNTPPLVLTTGFVHSYVPPELRLYYDRTADANYSTGTGFNDGQLILDEFVTENCIDSAGNLISTGTTITNNLTDSGPLDGAGIGATPTVGQSGSAGFCANRFSLDPTFFMSRPTGVLFSAILSAPFTPGVTSSEMLDHVRSNIGPINGLSGPDVLLESDGKLNFAPESSSISLVALVLVYLCAHRTLPLTRNRRSRSQQAWRLRATV